MFEPRNTFFRDGKKEFAISDNASGRVVHLRIIYAERDHLPEPAALEVFTTD